MLRYLKLQIRRGWNTVAEGTGLRNLPPVPTAALVLALGVLWPLAGEIRTRTADLANSLALDRIGRFADSQNSSADSGVGPTGNILSTRPAIFWPRDAKTTHYTVRIEREDGTAWIDNATTTSPFYVVSAAGSLEEGRGYRFAVRGYDAKGADTVKHDGSFTIGLRDKKLANLHERASTELGSFESSLVLSGYYAEQGSRDDVVGGLLAAFQADPKAFRREVADSNSDSARLWLARHVDPLTTADS